MISSIVVGSVFEDSENWNKNLKSLVGDKESLFTYHCQSFLIKWKVLVSFYK